MKKAVPIERICPECKTVTAFEVHLLEEKPLNSTAENSIDFLEMTKPDAILNWQKIFGRKYCCPNCGKMVRQLIYTHRLAGGCCFFLRKAVK